MGIVQIFRPRTNFYGNDVVEEYCTDLVGENKKGFGGISME